MSIVAGRRPRACLSLGVVQEADSGDRLLGTGRTVGGGRQRSRVESSQPPHWTCGRSIGRPVRQCAENGVPCGWREAHEGRLRHRCPTRHSGQCNCNTRLEYCASYGTTNRPLVRYIIFVAGSASNIIQSIYSVLTYKYNL